MFGRHKSRKKNVSSQILNEGIFVFGLLPPHRRTCSFVSKGFPSSPPLHILQTTDYTDGTDSLFSYQRTKIRKIHVIRCSYNTCESWMDFVYWQAFLNASLTVSMQPFFPEKFAKFLHSVTFGCYRLIHRMLSAVTEGFTLSLFGLFRGSLLQ